jgi:hypothetical protein
LINYIYYQPSNPSNTMLALGIKGVGSAEIEIGGAGVEKGFCANLSPSVQKALSLAAARPWI